MANISIISSCNRHCEYCFAQAVSAKTEKNDMASFVEISAKENANVDDAFKVLTELSLDRMSK